MQHITYNIPVEVYIAFDGTRFTEEEACKEHEKFYKPLKSIYLVQANRHIVAAYTTIEAAQRRVDTDNMDNGNNYYVHKVGITS